MQPPIRVYVLTFLFVGSLALGGCDAVTATVEPPAPSELTAQSGEGTVELTWTAPDIESVKGYNIYRSTSSFESVEGKQAVPGGSDVEDVSFADSNASKGSTYYYRVTVVDGGGNESKASNEASATAFPSPPDWP